MTIIACPKTGHPGNDCGIGRMALARLGSHISVMTLSQIMNPTTLSMRHVSPADSRKAALHLWALGPPMIASLRRRRRAHIAKVSCMISAAPNASSAAATMKTAALMPPGSATAKRMAAIDTSNPEMRWQVKQAISSATMPPDVWLSASAQRCPCAALQRRDRGNRSTCKTQHRDRSFGAKPCSAFVAQKPLRAQ